MQELVKEKSIGYKFLALVGILISCSILGSVLLFGLGMIGGMEIDSTIDIFAAVTDRNMRPYIKTGVGLNHLAMFSLTAGLFAYWMKKNDWKSYFDFKQFNTDLLLKFVLLLFLFYPLMGLSTMALENVNLPDWADSLDQSSVDSLMKLLQMDGVGDLITNLIIIAIIPAIGEELLFRGVIQKELVKEIKNPHIAIFIASVIFSGFHLQVQGFLPKLIIGVVLGYAYYWTGSIWYSIILHFVNNGLQTLILFFTADHLEALDTAQGTPESAQLITVVIISCFLCYLLIKHIKQSIKETERKYL